MANIRITVEGPLMDGHKITFKAPCDCSSVEKLDVRYIESNTQKSKLFTMKDSHGNDLTGLGNLFSQGAYVDVVLDPNSSAAYLQNASTNAYLEGKLKTVAAPVDNLTSTSTTLPLSARQGKVLNDGKVDKVSGKGLSTNDYTTDEKNKLSGIASGATKNTVDSSLSTSSANAIQNKAVATKFNTVDTNMGKIKVYVGSDGKLHFTNASGADTALNFSSGVKLGEFVTTGVNSSVLSISNLVVGKTYAMTVTASNASESDKDTLFTSGVQILKSCYVNYTGSTKTFSYIVKATSTKADTSKAIFASLIPLD